MLSWARGSRHITSALAVVASGFVIRWMLVAENWRIGKFGVGVGVGLGLWVCVLLGGGWGLGLSSSSCWLLLL